MRRQACFFAFSPSKKAGAPGLINVHSPVQAKTKLEAERVGKYMIRPILSLERLSFSEKEGKVCYRYGKEAEEVEWMDYLLKLTFVASKPPPPPIAYQEVLMAAEAGAEYFS